MSKRGGGAGASSNFVECEVDEPRCLSEQAEEGVPSFFLLYLDRRTFHGPLGAQLAAEVREACRLGSVRFLLLHLQDGEHGMCEFADFFTRTPRDLPPSTGAEQRI